jgi:phage baseplate assembly protein W
MMIVRQPWRLGGRRLTPATYFEHLDALVRIVLLTGPNERLHHPGFGAGLGASTLFEPLSQGLEPTVVARIRGSLMDALGDRIQVLDVAVRIEESTLSAEVSYRPLPAGEPRTVVTVLPGGAS